MIYTLKHVKPNPSIELAQEIMASIPSNCTEIVSQGGGSTIDVGKWCARKLGLKHTAIPTTAGTGSEVTKFVVLTVDGKKKTFTDDKFIPDSYILDPSLVASLPPEQTLATGLDALSQSLEAFWSINATPDSNFYAETAIKLIFDNLLISYKEPNNLHARMNMLLGANFSGRAINITKTNVCHAISYPLTDLYGVPHGIACGLSLDFFSKKAVGIDVSVFTSLIDVSKYNINKEAIAEIAIKNTKLLDYPYKITKKDILTALNML